MGVPTEEELQKIAAAFPNGEFTPEVIADIEEKFQASLEAFTPSDEGLALCRHFSAEDLAFTVVRQTRD